VAPATFFFYLFASIVTLSAIGVVFARNPVHSVLFLILAFFNAAGLFLLAGAEFLGLILVIVYVGAVAVLFLFGVMMLNLDFRTLRTSFRKSGPLALAVGLLLLAELVVFILASQPTGAPASAAIAQGVNPGLIAHPMAAYAELSNTEALGQLLYTTYAPLFQGGGLILLLAMIGAIVLTLRRRQDLKRQDIPSQVARGRTVRLTKPSIGEGVE